MRDFHQLFDPASSTFTYKLVDPATREAVIIDPVDTHLDAHLRLFEMGSLDLPKPRLLDIAVPANQRLGLDIHQA